MFRVAHQLHGAIGFCDETALSWVSRASVPLRRLPFGHVGHPGSAHPEYGSRDGLPGLFNVAPSGAPSALNAVSPRTRTRSKRYGSIAVMDLGLLRLRRGVPRRGADLDGRSPGRRLRLAGRRVGSSARETSSSCARRGSVSWQPVDGSAWAGRLATEAASLPLAEQIIFNEEYVRSGGPNRVGFFGEELLGPTLMMFGTDEQKSRFLPGILEAEEFWCQGFSEPDAGSDLANVKTTAVRDGEEWVINGQKVWTSLGHISDWIFVVCRTDTKAARKHDGISFLLCPVDQPGVEMRPIRQMTGTAEFNEVFFTDARTDADLVVGEVGHGWKVVLATLGFERGTAFLGQQLRWGQEFQSVLEDARRRGRNTDPVVPPAAGRCLHRVDAHAVERPAFDVAADSRRHPRARGLGGEAALVRVAPAPGGAQHGPAWVPRAWCRPKDTSTTASTSSCSRGPRRSSPVRRRSSAT